MTNAVRPDLPTGRILLLIGGIYTGQSVISSIAFIGVPAVLRASGASLDLVGAVSLLMLPWALKFLWAPAVERLRLPAAGPQRSRRIILAGQAAAMAAVALLALIRPEAAAEPLFAILALSAAIAATVDIACDGFAIEQLRPEIRGWGNTVQVGGGYLGMMAGGGAFLFLAHGYGWEVACLGSALLLGVLTLPTLVTLQPAGRGGAHPHRPSLAVALGRREMRVGLVVAALCQCGPRLAQSMVTPLLIDRELDLAAVGSLTGVAGVAVVLLGTAVAGLAIRRCGPAAALHGCVALQALVLGGFLALLIVPSVPVEALAVLALFKSGVMAAGFVTLYTMAMGWSSLRQAGVDFTLFQCADAAVAGAAGLAGGALAQRFGYPVCFGAAAVAAATATLLLPALLTRASQGVRS